MKYPTLIFILFVLSTQFLHAKPRKEVYIDSASQFEGWCRYISYRHFKKQKQKAYNWSASTIRKLNDYQTVGHWRVGRNKKKVFCQIRIGKKAKSTKIEIR